MADSRELASFVLKWETSKYTNDKNDKGGPTKYGITLATWRKVGYDKNGDGKINEEDVKLLTNEDYNRVFKNNFWDACQADSINDQSVANMLVDFAYNSGISRASKYIQKIVGATVDGIIGTKTIGKINSYKFGQKALFETLKKERIKYLKKIGVGSQEIYLKGWLRRDSYITYGNLK